MTKMTGVVALLVLLFVPLAAQDLEVELQRAIQQETVGGDLKAAIEAYRAIAARAGANRGVAAKALLRMADAHRKLGDAEARRVYERIATDYADQKDAATEARARLAALRPTTPPSAGVTARQISTAKDPTGAPSLDGRVLSFTDWSTGDVAVRDLVTGTTRRVTKGGNLDSGGVMFAEFSVPSPDGREVAYSWFTELAPTHAAYDLRVAPLGNGEPAGGRVVHRDDKMRWIAPGAWTPDGKMLVVMRHLSGQPLELAIVNVTTGAVRSLKTFRGPSQRVSVSPDGQFIAYDQPSGRMGTSRDVFVIRIDGTAETAVAATPSSEDSPLWSPDGSQVLFLSDRTGTQGLWSVDVRNGKPVGQQRLIKSGLGSFHPLGMTRAGALYYFESGDQHNVFVADLDAELKPVGEPVLVTDNFYNANISGVWSPDGQSIAYYRYRGILDTQGVTLMIRDAKSGRERGFPLSATVARNNATALKWFDSGRSLLVVGRDEEGFAYHRVDAATGAETVLWTVKGAGPGANNPAITPDGKTIFHIEASEPGKTRNLRRVDVDTKQETVLLTGWIHSVALSPDGTEVAYIGTREGATPRTAEIGIIQPSGGMPRVLFEATWTDSTRFGGVSWTPDGRHLLFVRPDENAGMETIWRVPVAGGAPQKVVTRRGRVRHPSLHPDGRRLLFSVRVTSGSAISVLENFLPPAAVVRKR